MQGLTVFIISLHIVSGKLKKGTAVFNISDCTATDGDKVLLETPALLASRPAVY